MSMASDRDPPSYDWSARVRTTTMEALRYSRFVVLMKRVLAYLGLSDEIYTRLVTNSG